MYRDASDAGVREAHAATIAEIKNKELLYPVIVVDGLPVYDGAISYPAVVRAVSDKLAQAAS